MTMETTTYSYIAQSGVQVHTCTPISAKNDFPTLLHCTCWSYAQWLKKIVQSFRGRS